MTEQKVSLVVPAFNEEKRIGACLDAALKSSAKFYEIIVVDNASTDRTRDEALKRTGVRVIEEKQKGPNFARQKGFLESRGDLIAFTDADSIIPEGWLEIALSEFKTDENLALLSGPDYYPDINFIQRGMVYIFFLVAMPLYFLTGYMAVFNNIVIRRDVLEKMGGIDTSIHFYGDDTDIARRASKFGKVKFSRKFVMNTSGRRLVQQGIFKAGSIYVINFFSAVFRKRPATVDYNNFR